jgi:hypothetical protein
METLLQKVLSSNEKNMREMRETRLVMNKVLKALEESSTEWIDGVSGSRLLNSGNPRVLQKLREQGHLKDKTDYYWQGKGFMYRRAKLVEIREGIIRGEIGVKANKA